MAQGLGPWNTYQGKMEERLSWSRSQMVSEEVQNEIPEPFAQFQTSDDPI